MTRKSYQIHKNDGSKVQCDSLREARGYLSDMWPSHVEGPLEPVKSALDKARGGVA